MILGCQDLGMLEFGSCELEMLNFGMLGCWDVGIIGYLDVVML